MDLFEAAYQNRRWANAMESYTRFTKIMKNGSPYIKAWAIKHRNRVRSEWPTQQKVFDAIDLEVLAK